MTRDGFVEPFQGDLPGNQHQPRMIVMGLNPVFTSRRCSPAPASSLKRSAASAAIRAGLRYRVVILCLRSRKYSPAAWGSRLVRSSNSCTATDAAAVAADGPRRGSCAERSTRSRSSRASSSELITKDSPDKVASSHFTVHASPSREVGGTSIMPGLCHRRGQGPPGRNGKPRSSTSNLVFARNCNSVMEEAWVPLSEHDRQVLAQMEHDLSGDAKLVKALRSTNANNYALRRLRRSAFLFGLGLATLVFAVVVGSARPASCSACLDSSSCCWRHYAALRSFATCLKGNVALDARSRKSLATSFRSIAERAQQRWQHRPGN